MRGLIFLLTITYKIFNTNSYYPKGYYNFTREHLLPLRVVITIENFRFVCGNLFSNKHLQFYSRAFTTLKGIHIFESGNFPACYFQVWYPILK